MTRWIRIASWWRFSIAKQTTTRVVWSPSYERTQESVVVWSNWWRYPQKGALSIGGGVESKNDTFLPSHCQHIKTTTTELRGWTVHDMLVGGIDVENVPSFLSSWIKSS